jgi:uncharacterized damage-inducible protein DinB
VATYTSRELATAFRRVRGNTLRVAEDIPEGQYGFQPTPDTRTVARLLVHVAVAPRLQTHIHQSGTTDLSRVDVPALFQGIVAVELEPWTKAAVLELLREEGERFGSFLEGLTDAFLDERVSTPNDPSPAKSRLEMLMGVKEHEMHHRGQLMVIQRMIGLVPHLTRQMEERHARIRADRAR